MKIGYLFLSALSLSLPCFGSVIVIESGEIEITPVTLPDEGDKLLIENGGILVTETTSVMMNNDNQATQNKGNITTTGDNANGIMSSGVNAVITNSGMMLATGETARIINNFGENAIISNSGMLLGTENLSRGINNNGANTLIVNGGQISLIGDNTIGIASFTPNCTIINSGTILTTGSIGGGGINNQGANTSITNSGRISNIGSDLFVGIFSNEADVKIKNNGIITTTADGSPGILNGPLGENSVIKNSGHILTSGNNSSDGIRTGGSNSVVNNSGTILISGNQSAGINNLGENTVITNSGHIIATGDDLSAGIVSSAGSDVHVINSGTIRSRESFALLFQNETNPTLTLLRGSNLQGLVQVTEDLLNLNVETGLNLALTLTDVSSGFNNLGIEAPFVLLADTIAVIDPTGFTLQPDLIADLSDTILNNIYRCRLDCCGSCSCGIWAQGIGSYRKRSHDHHYVGYENLQSGFLIGYNAPFCKGLTSLFAGATFGHAEVDQQTQKADVNSYFGGLTYETCFCGTFIGLAVAAGYVDWDNARFVMNNLANGGVERAHADISGVFISPELTFAREFPTIWCHPALTFTFRYAGFFPGNYQENGSIADLSVKRREIDLLTSRFEFAVPYSNQLGRCCWKIEPYVGAFGRYQVGGYKVDAELLGQSIQFDQEGRRNLVALLLGFRGIQSFGCLNLFLNVEASFDKASASRIIGQGGIGWNF
ncbi:MAG: autotransporter domain-containing protein [Chlamydiales bacterium]|nr:autotransporter domain-containing protein [Chlamydiales bacterium]